MNEGVNEQNLLLIYRFWWWPRSRSYMSRRVMLRHQYLPTRTRTRTRTHTHTHTHIYIYIYMRLVVTVGFRSVLRSFQGRRNCEAPNFFERVWLWCRSCLKSYHEIFASPGADFENMILQLLPSPPKESDLGPATEEVTHLTPSRPLHLPEYVAFDDCRNLAGSVQELSGAETTNSASLIDFF